MPRLEIKDNRGDHNIEQLAEINGELWIDDSYCGQFTLDQNAEMVIVNRTSKIEVVMIRRNDG